MMEIFTMEMGVIQPVQLNNTTLVLVGVHTIMIHVLKHVVIVTTYNLLEDLLVQLMLVMIVILYLEMDVVLLANLNLNILVLELLLQLETLVLKYVEMENKWEVHISVMMVT